MSRHNGLQEEGQGKWCQSLLNKRFFGMAFIPTEPVTFAYRCVALAEHDESRMKAMQET